ncbi:hypothetical protein [Streptomyces sp. Agncl-13]|uniref:hypothetical protein n=1 Tax=Streptomyces sp. Agncl-13 TaxID=3400628 RepID=UPI003A884C1A
MEYATVRGLALPAQLTSLLDQGRWRHPGDAEMARLIPWFESPVDFLATAGQMEWESSSLDTFDDDRYAAFLHVARGGGQETPVELPWLDVEKAFFIAVNRVPGDDVGLALDLPHRRPRPAGRGQLRLDESTVVRVASRGAHLLCLRRCPGSLERSKRCAHRRRAWNDQ